MSSCATEQMFSVLKSPYVQATESVGTIVAISTFIITYFAIRKVVKESIFNISTKILLILYISFANLHQICYLFIMISNLYRGLLYVDLCEVMLHSLFCDPITLALVTGISGMVFIQTGLLIERTIATFTSNYSTPSKYRSGVVIGIITSILSMFPYKIVTWDDPLDGYTMGCLNYPIKSANRANVYLFILVILSLINLVYTVLLMAYNKSVEFRTRFNLQGRFHSREVIDSTITICFISLIQFICMFVYSFRILIMRLFKSYIPPEVNSVLILWVYDVPFAALFLPVTLIYLINRIRRKRIESIHNITHQNETMDEHMNRLNQLWN